MIKLTEEKRLELATVASPRNKKVVKELVEICGMCTDEEDVYELYANMAGFLFYGQEYLAKVDTGLNFISYMTVEVLKTAQEDVFMFNKFIHAIHSQFSECREYAIEKIGHTMGNKDMYILRSTNVHQGEVPSDIRKLIDNCLASIRDDLSYTISTTWNFSHLYCGIDYNYQANESVKVDLISLSQQALDLAVDRLSKLDSTLAK